jgi:hypothetical protein
MSIKKFKIEFLHFQTHEMHNRHVLKDNIYYFYL